MPSIRPIMIAMCALLAGCSENPSPDRKSNRQDDPLLSAALAEPLMTDPDLAMLNMASAASVDPKR